MGLEIKELIQIGAARLNEAGCMESKLDAELLLCYMMQFDRSKLLMHWSDTLNDKSCEAYFQLVDTRAGGMPLQYITGEQEFMGIGFSVDERVLIPRQDTETLVELILADLDETKGSGGNMVALDLCTGSGAIAVSLCKHRPGLKLTATDVSEDALAVAKKNAEIAGVKNRIKLVESDLFQGFRTGIGGPKFNLIVSNPPYIPTGELPKLQREIYAHEPLLALDGGEDGLEFYRQIARQASGFLKKEGWLYLEIGWDQGDAVTNLLRQEDVYDEIDVHKDLAGNDRVVRARKHTKAKGKR